MHRVAIVGGTRSHMVATWAALAVLSVLAAVVGLSLGPVATPGASAEVGSTAGVAPQHRRAPRAGRRPARRGRDPDRRPAGPHPGRDAAGAAAARGPRHHVRQRDGADLAVLPVAGVAADRPVRARHRRVVQLPTDRWLVALPRGRQRGPHPGHCAGDARLPHRPGRQVLQLVRQLVARGLHPAGMGQLHGLPYDAPVGGLLRLPAQRRQRARLRPGRLLHRRAGAAGGAVPRQHAGRPATVPLLRAVRPARSLPAGVAAPGHPARRPHALLLGRDHGGRVRQARLGAALSARCLHGGCGTSNAASRRHCSP